MNRLVFLWSDCVLGNAIAYDWLYDALAPAEQQTVRGSLVSWARKMHQASSAAPYVDG